MFRMCVKCGIAQEVTQFGNPNKPTQYCQTCRDYAKETMRRFHSRRKLGMAVQRGRPRKDNIMQPIRVLYTIPAALQKEIEAYIKEKVENHSAKYAGHHTAGKLPLGFEFGAELAMPRTTNRALLNPDNKPGAKQNHPRPRTEDEQLFFDTVSETTKKVLTHSAHAKTAMWMAWDGQYRLWIEAGRPKNFNHKEYQAARAKAKLDTANQIRQEVEERDTASEPERQG